MYIYYIQNVYKTNNNIYIYILHSKTLNAFDLEILNNSCEIFAYKIYILSIYVPSFDDEHTPQLWQYLALSKSFVPQLWQNMLHGSKLKKDQILEANASETLKFQKNACGMRVEFILMRRPGNDNKVTCARISFKFLRKSCIFSTEKR